MLCRCVFHNGAVALCAFPVCVSRTGPRTRQQRGEVPLTEENVISSQYLTAVFTHCYTCGLITLNIYICASGLLWKMWRQSL